MDTETQVYRALQKHLDRLPIGYPPTESGVEIRILEQLFSPKEAKIATHLSILPESSDRIYKRVEKAGISKGELEEILDQMADKGVIWRIMGNDEKRYSNLFFLIGIYEHQVDRLTKEFAEDQRQYLEEAFGDELSRTRIPQLRTIPIEKSIESDLQVSTYDSLRQIVEDAGGHIAVQNCICRHAKDLIGDRCHQTNLRETCFSFDTSADNGVSHGFARYIDKEEAFRILDKVEEDGLVIQPSNTQQVTFICCCCGDCCDFLINVKRLPHPADLYATNYYSQVNHNTCTGCQLCIDRCQLGALAMTNGTATVNLDRCIGCGNCIAVCTDNAITLHKKTRDTVPPKNVEALYKNIWAKRIGKWNILKIGIRMLFRMKV